MLRFFSKIRLKLAAENKPVKYMRYAVGEIVLVVIGILIALQVNNWNEQRKQEVLEIQFLVRLVADIADDTTYYNARLEYSKFAVSKIDTYIKEAYKEQKNIGEASKLLNNLVLNTDHLTINNSTHTELTNTGGLSILRKQKLKESIIEYYRKTNEIASDILEFNTVTDGILIETVGTVKNLLKLILADTKVYEGPKMINENEWKFINEPTSNKFQSLESMAIFYRFRYLEHSSYFKQLKNSSGNLITQINEELEHR